MSIADRIFNAETRKTQRMRGESRFALRRLCDLRVSAV